MLQYEGRVYTSVVSALTQQGRVNQPLAVNVSRYAIAHRNPLSNGFTDTLLQQHQ